MFSLTSFDSKMIVATVVLALLTLVSTGGAATAQALTTKTMARQPAIRRTVVACPL